MEATITPTAETETKEAIQLAVRFEKYAITAPNEYKTAADDLKTIKGKAKDLDELRKSLTKPLDDSKKRIMDLFRVPMERLADAESSIKSAMISYQQEQERIRQAEESRLREIQRQEQIRIQQEQERIRLEQEAIRKAAEEAAKQGETESAEILQMEAEIAAEEAKKVEVQAFAVAVAPVVVAPTIRPISGISIRKIWKFRVVDANLIPREYLLVDESKLGKLATTLKESATVPGVVFYSEDSVSAGR
jgi:hypothetical protein